MVYPKLCVMINLMSFQHKLHASNYMGAMNLIHIHKDMNVTMKISGQTIFNVLEQRQVYGNAPNRTSESMIVISKQSAYNYIVLELVLNKYLYNLFMILLLVLCQ
jgi:hypothetical protein